MFDNGFKAGYANALQKMMEEKLPGCGIKATPPITSRLKTLNRLWQAAYDIVYGPNTSRFGWDPKTKLVTADKEVWDEYMKVRSPCDNGSNGSLHSSKESSLKQKIQRMEEIKRGKQNDGDKSSDEQEHEEDENVSDKSFNEQEHEEDENVSDKSSDEEEEEEEDQEEDNALDNSSHEEQDEEEDNVGVDHVRAKLYKELKRQQRTKLPEAKHDFNNSKLEKLVVERN
ncbi:hypothetical protein K1719_004229 [Acacia pycnantha]|nr:hypothetical protein K1719_004229 [Acacia pycnantha]